LQRKAADMQKSTIELSSELLRAVNTRRHL
jgi:hypothetical protein